MAKTKRPKYEPAIILSSAKVGFNAKTLREQRKLSQVFVANELGVSDSTLSEMENGKREWTVENVQKVAAILETEPTALLATGGVIIDSGNNSPGAFGGYYSNSTDDKQTDILKNSIETLTQLFKEQMNFFSAAVEAMSKDLKK